MRALEAQRPLIRKNMPQPVFRAEDDMAGIVGSHSLIPDALHHAFSTFAVLMSPELPLTRRQHEMITTYGFGYEPVLLLNRIARRVFA